MSEFSFEMRQFEQKNPPKGIDSLPQTLIF